MPTQDQIINDLIKVMDDAVTSFNDDMPSVQKRAYGKVVEMLADLDKVGGNVKVTVKNLKIFRSIRKELEGIIFDDKYKKKVDEFVKSYDEVTKLNNAYFYAVSSDFTTKAVFEEIKQASIESVKENLLNSGMKANVVNKLNDIMIQNMTTSVKYSDLVDQVRVFLTDSKDGDGALVKYAKNLTTDSINQFNAQYTATATNDLGLQWYKYVGSLLTTSRAFCVHLIDAKKEGMPFIHISQFPQLLKGQINGQQIPINPKTNLPYGMNKETNPSNLEMLRGGYGCAHHFYPVSSAIVPKALKDKYE